MSNLDLLTPSNELELILRLALALGVGTIIGIERETKSKPAGLRTNMLVSFGAALVVLIPIQTGMAQAQPDILGRAIAGVISGVGFIGGGTILRDNKIRGLTSASAIWVSATLGMVVGCGLWKLGLFSAGITWLILRIVAKFETRL